MSPKRHLPEDYDDDEARPLTAEERRVLRRMIEDDARVRWFWSSFRIWVGWISAAIVGAWSMVEIASKIWKRTL